jgi:radial spoke head protein 4A
MGQNFSIPDSKCCHYFLSLHLLSHLWVTEVPAGQDAPGTGVNSHAYWVSASVFGPWVKLPDTNAEHIVNAQKIRKFFTGNLDAPLTGFPVLVYTPAKGIPPLPGAAAAEPVGVSDRATYAKYNTERYLLRAQLGRIAAATVVAPVGAYSKGDDGEGPWAKVDAPAPFAVAELTDLAKWQHTRRHIYPSGVTKIADPDDAEKDAGGVDPFRDLAADDGAHWAARVTPHLSGDLHPAVMVKSLTWPGAVCVCKRNAYAAIYIGHGLKHTTALTFPAPAALPPLQSECVAPLLYISFVN